MNSVSDTFRGPLPDGLAIDNRFDILVRTVHHDNGDLNEWLPVTGYATKVASANITRNEFDSHTVAVASVDVAAEMALELKVRYHASKVQTAKIRPTSLGISTQVRDDTIYFTLDKAVDIMLEVNNDKWQAMHLLVNTINPNEPTGEDKGVWYFGSGVNNGNARDKIHDGRLIVPSDITVYLASGAFLTAQLLFMDVKNSSVKGPGFIFRPPYDANSSAKPRELAGGAILIERSQNIMVQGVTSLRSYGFSLCVGQGQGVHIDRYRSFSGYGNGDGIDLFCCQDILVENCFLRNSDDTIAIYGHRWEYYGNTTDIQVKNCTLLPDIAHPIQMGTHGDPNSPETFENIHFSNINILDQCENQMWYQGCIAINAGDENLIQDILIEDVIVERITKGQLFNIRVMKNAMWTTAPGRGIKNVTFRNLELRTGDLGTVNPSQILGFDSDRKVENITFQNLKIGGKFIHDFMPKPRWYMVSDLVPLFANEHVDNVSFKLKNK